MTRPLRALANPVPAQPFPPLPLAAQSCGGASRVRQTFGRVAAAFLLALGSTGTASAGPLIDFSLGPTGDLGVYQTTIGGIDVASFRGTVYRWRGEHCCEHVDRGLGALSPGEQINPAEPELNRGEFLRLRRPMDDRWTGLWFSSVNDVSALKVYAGIYPVGSSLLVTASGAAADATVLLPIPPAWQYAPALWVVPTAGYTVLWGADLQPYGIQPDPVPEPGTLLLVGSSLLLVARRRRRG